MTKEEATIELSRLVELLDSTLAAAVMLATEYQLGFRPELPYGMGGRFDGRSVGVESYQYRSDGWFASSQSC